MKLHSDIITEADLYAAASRARHAFGSDIFIDDSVTRGSRSRKRGIEFHAGSEHGRYARNTGQWGGNTYDRAASWSDWGVLIALLFKLDPDAIIGYYKSAKHFVNDASRQNRPAKDKRFLAILES